MANQLETKIRLEVYYPSAQPIATLLLEPEDEYLAWLVDSLPVAPRGDHYCLYLANPREFRQARRIFPAIGGTNRHVRFRSLLRKKAQNRKPTPLPAITSWPLHPEPSAETRPTNAPGVSWRHVVSLFKLSLSRF
ncbi:hypothetical protein [Rufibacter psychrotolerans]|uniref:hypothetical protein n=1 Tax=Rufibacter psychrotolerans TaxID=2812556 RepID=UPI001966EA3F|nr:hypothetical protein [Rufibacter sp. SYSU D00308]